MQNPLDRIRKTGAPGTAIVIALSVASFFAAFLTNGKFTASIAFLGSLNEPWRIVTWPFACDPLGFGFIWNLLAWAWFWWVGGALEREFGTSRLVIGFFVASLLGLAFLCIGGSVFGLSVIEPATYNGLLLGDAALTVYFGLRHRTAAITMFGLVQMNGPILAGVTAMSILLGYGGAYRQPMMGFFGCIHLIIAAMIARGSFAPRRVSTADTRSGRLKKTEMMSSEYYADVRKREQDRQERERLRKLFESSISDEDAKDR